MAAPAQQPPPPQPRKRAAEGSPGALERRPRAKPVWVMPYALLVRKWAEIAGAGGAGEAAGRGAGAESPAADAQEAPSSGESGAEAEPAEAKADASVPRRGKRRRGGGGEKEKEKEKEKEEEEEEEEDKGADVVYPITKATVTAVSQGVDRLLASRRLATSPAYPSRDAVAAALMRALLEGAAVTPELAAQARADAEQLWRMALDADGKSRRLLGAEPYIFGAGAGNTQPSAAFAASVNRFAELQERTWMRDARSPFAAFRFSVDPATLGAERRACPSCGRRVALYCCRCFCAVEPRLAALPPVALPLDIVVIHHPQESPSKSTALQGVVLSPRQCRWCEYPEQVPQLDPATSLLLFPDAGARSLDAVDLSRIRTVAVIESTWQKGPAMARHPLLAALPHVRMDEVVTTFWRTQEHSNRFLATLEAMFHFCRQVWERREGRAYDGRFDDLMLIYAHMHARVAQKQPAALPRNWRAHRIAPAPTAAPEDSS